MTHNVSTWTTAKPAEPVTIESILQAIQSLASAPVVTMVGGKSVEHLMARLGFHKARVENWLIGTDVHVCDWLPDDFLLIEEETQEAVRLFVYRLHDGEFEAFEVMPPYVLYRSWRAIVGRYKRKGGDPIP